MRNRIFHQVRIAGITFEGIISADGPYISASTAGGVALVVSALRHFQPETVGSRRPQPAGWWVVKYHSEERIFLPDFDRAVELKPDSTDAHLRRAEFEFGKKDEAAAFADLDAVDRLLAPQAESRFILAKLYQEHDRMAEAIAQYTLWIANHPVDFRMGNALAQRCRSRALANQDLPAALSDCNTVLRRSKKSDPGYSGLYVDRALVRLRLGDANDALKLKPTNSTALFVRALAEARKNQTGESAADLAEAKRIKPQVADGFARFGIAP